MQPKMHTQYYQTKIKSLSKNLRQVEALNKELLEKQKQTNKKLDRLRKQILILKEKLQEN